MPAGIDYRDKHATVTTSIFNLKPMINFESEPEDSLEPDPFLMDTAGIQDSDVQVDHFGYMRCKFPHFRVLVILLI
jgi:hypothetical protein